MTKLLAILGGTGSNASSFAYFVNHAGATIGLAHGAMATSPLARIFDVPSVASEPSGEQAALREMAARQG